MYQVQAVSDECPRGCISCPRPLKWAGRVIYRAWTSFVILLDTGIAKAYGSVKNKGTSRFFVCIISPQAEKILAVRHTIQPEITKTPLTKDNYQVYNKVINKYGVSRKAE